MLSRQIRQGAAQLCNAGLAAVVGCKRCLAVAVSPAASMSAFSMTDAVAIVVHTVRQAGMQVPHSARQALSMGTQCRGHCGIKFGPRPPTRTETQAAGRGQSVQMVNGAHRLATASSWVAQMYLGFAPRRLGAGSSPPLPPELGCQSSAAASSTALSDHAESQH